MAGHSKWANIRHRKAIVDARRGKLFTRLAREITIAARLGGGDPEANPRLRLAIENARAANMPTENIRRAILRGTGELQGEHLEEVLYEGYGPFGVALLIEVATDNRNRTVSQLRSTLSRLGGNLGESGSVLWNFERRGVLYVEAGSLSEEELLEYALEAGADDVVKGDGNYIVYCPPSELAHCQRFFQEHNLVVKEAKLEWLPKTTVRIETREQAERLLKFLETIEDLDDVQNVYSNFEMDDALLEELQHA
ncbi:MAG: YebC/PmpR family DNA-binding transcriptional regulator [Chlorobiota bacterium]